ncbi:MAG: HAD-IB family phosphatase [Pirellulales bacterium]
MVSVIIPALNEARTIAFVIRFALACPLVREVIVVDDGSTDATVEISLEAGAKVITSSLLGKGASMSDGIREANEEIILFLDGDLENLPDRLIEKMVAPIQTDEIQFVKASFRRRAGRVTSLTARPLLQTFFPELTMIAQPLGGIIAAKKDILATVSLESDYGVDLGLLIDIHMKGYRIAEVDVGFIEHRSQDLHALEGMARQVTRTILHRALLHNRLTPTHVAMMEENERHHKSILKNAVRTSGASARFALFDMDETLIQRRFILELARRTHRTERILAYLDRPDLNAVDRTLAIAKVLQGISQSTMIDVATQIPLQAGAIESVRELKRRGYHVGIISDSYFIATEVVRRRVFADFSQAHTLRFENNVATGELEICRSMVESRHCRKHLFCKANVVVQLERDFSAKRHEMVAVGDSENDICMLGMTGNSFAFQPKTPRVALSAKQTLRHSLEELFDHLPDIAGVGAHSHLFRWKIPESSVLPAASESR